MKIWENKELDNDKTIVVIGPNGSGKTRYGIKLSKLNDGDHIGALRNIALQENLPVMALNKAESEVRNQLNIRKKRYWELSSEIDLLFSKLMADDSASATKFRDIAASGQTPELETTKIMELKKLWEMLFPNRTISFEGYVPKVKSEYMAGAEYSARFMSDGERVALYLAARVLDSNSEVVIIDEPEVHFHSKLAVKFWDELEKLRPEKKFVYITHNLEFALSRANPIFLIVKPNEEPIIIQKASDIPQKVSIDLLAAASLSIFAKRIVFCEGKENGSKENDLLTSWFKDSNTVVIPLSSCKNVIEAVLAYKKTDIIQNVEVIGIIDQDYSSAELIEALNNHVFVLPVHEIESLFLLEDVMRAVLEHLGSIGDEINALILEVKEQSKDIYSNDLINKTISERFKKELEFQLNFKVRGIRSNNNNEQQKEEHLNITNELVAVANNLYDKCEQEIRGIAEKEYLEILKLMPGKPLISLLTSKLGIRNDRYLKVVCNMIENDNVAVIDSLKEFLPPKN